MSWNVNDRVEVRANTTQPWRAGAVRHVPSEGHPGCPKGCYAVELDSPISGNDWTGSTRKYGGAELVGSASSLVFVTDAANTVAQGDHIRSEGG